MSGAAVADQQTSVTVTVDRLPIQTAQISVLVFQDNNPINNEPNFGFEPGLPGFSILIFDQLGQVSMDAFGNPLGTEYVFTTDVNGNKVPVSNPDGSPVVLTMGTGVIISDANGEAFIKYLAPGKYGIEVVSPIGTPWVQTNTIEGTKRIDAWVKSGESRLLIEFGPALSHVFFGFVQPTDLLNTLPVPPGGSLGTITGRIVKVHSTRPPLVTLNPGEPVGECYIGLNTLGAGTQTGVYVATANDDGTFTINNVPPGTYQLVTWDLPLDVIFNFTTVVVPLDGGTVTMGDIPVNMWFGVLKGTVFYDTNGNGVMDPGEKGIPNQVVNLRFRDASMYLTTMTDGDGNYVFSEVFPWFKFIIVEVDFTRFRATGATVVVDNGGPIANIPVFPYGITNLTPQPQPENGSLPYRVETAPEPVLLEAMMLFADQTNIINWGKQNYPPGTNGGIAGIVYYATTRTENDPSNDFADPWEPGIPGVQINLYEDFDQDGVPDGAAIDSVLTDSWDNLQPTGCVGPTQHVNVNGVSTPVVNCAETLRTWNQVRPGVFDGGYIFYNIPVGTYIVEVVPPTGYEIVKEENVNIFNGEQYTPGPLLLLPICVGPDHTVPDFLTLFVDQQIPAPFAGQSRPLCTRKQVSVVQGRNSAADFHLFTEVPKAARGVGLITNDLAITLNPNNPVFTEKSTPAWIPISFRNFRGREVVRVYSDQFGAYNALIPSTYTVNPPIPTGVSPNMLTVCLNDPNKPDPNNPGQVIPDPQFDPRFSQTCYNLDFWPGKTTYLDTPLIPTAAFTGATNTNLDCEYPTGTPMISQATSSENAGNGGPYVSVADGSKSITITSAGSVSVPNPNFDPFVSGSPPFILRDYGFGTVQGTGTVTVNGAPLTVTSWSATTITATVPGGITTGQLVVTRGDTGKSSEMGITLHVGNGGNPVAYVFPSIDPAAHPIQDAIDAAAPNTLILAGPGIYNENPILYKSLKLQGFGPGSTKINASPFPTSKIASWEAKFAQLVASNSIDFVPGQDQTLTNEKSPGIMVIPKNATFGSNPRALIDGFNISGASVGGGIYVNGYAHYLEISNNRITNNIGSFGGGIRIGTPSIPVANPANGYQTSFNDHISIHNNQINQNSTGGFNGAGGISIFNGSDFYSISNNTICGNFTTQNGAGILHFGLSDQGYIGDSKILLNEAAFGSATGGSAGGIYISGEPARIGAPGNVTPGTGSITIDANLIQGNIAGNGLGGAILDLFRQWKGCL